MVNTEHPGDVKPPDPQLESTLDTPEHRDVDEDVVPPQTEEIRTEAEAGPRRADLALTQSHATDASATTQATTVLSRVDDTKKSKWSKLNPLRWGGIPALPATLESSPEHRAGFLSLLTFQWMTPLMTVSDIPSRFVRTVCAGTTVWPARIAAY